MPANSLPTLIRVFANSRFSERVFIVGGYVRDQLFGIDPEDIDILVVGNAEAGIEAAIYAAHELDIYKEDSNPVVYGQHGTAMLLLPSGQKLEFIGSGDAVGSTKQILITDAERRDFTINSLVQTLETGEVLDPTGKGLADITSKTLRTPVDPNITLSDDPLRAIRAIRFTIALNLQPEQQLIESINRSASLITNVSFERVRTELVKLLLLGQPSKAIRLLQSTNLLHFIIPELEATVGVTQNKFHDKDVFEHSLAALDASPRIINSRLGALFHDIGKVTTRTDVGEKVQFIGHPEAGAIITRTLMKRLKFPNQQSDDVALIVERHMDLKHAGPQISNLKDGTLRRFINKSGENFENILDVIHADNVSHAPNHNMPHQVNLIRKRLAGWNLEECLNPKLAIDGNDVADLGVKGPHIGEILKRIKWHHLERNGLDRESAMQIAQNMASSGPTSSH